MSVESKDIEDDLSKDLEKSCNISNEEILNDMYILNEFQNFNKNKKTEIFEELKNIAPNLPEKTLFLIYEKSISIRQKFVQKGGNKLEDIIEKFILNKKIEYKKQVTINEKGIIIGFNIKNKCFHIVDIVIGNNIEIGNNINNYIVLSCKKTCRERWTQDNWSLEIKPKLFILITISNDYPSSIRFQERKERIIITCNPKKRMIDYINIISKILFQ